MSTELDRLVVSLEANIDAYERELGRAAPVAERALAQAERAAAAGAARIQAAMARAGEGVRAEIARVAAPAGASGATPMPAQNPDPVPAPPASAAPRTSASEDDFTAEVARLTKRTGLLRVEAETVGRSEGAAAKAEAAFRLLDAAKKADLAVTPQLTAEIEKVATAYGAAAEQVETAERAQRAFRQASRDFGAALSEGLKGAILDGEKLNVVLSRLVTMLAAKSIDRTVEGLFSKGGAGSDLLGQVFGGLGFDLNPTGRAEGGPVTPGLAYTVGERGRETFVPLQPGRILPAARSSVPPQAPPPIQVSVSIATPDAPSFARSEAQITAALARAVQRGLRGM
ncbi:hypothetical protein [Methylobacterium nodulans]|uniref:Uncharacterized protein n=1 Tax=Methylobacterium nodulans (strain LMG 21967 / CNCM I-2342 / ORS 2060) TaxID=460265 RepID=B8IDH3_METNO|nr:hypothetical protein [Methylobacterium nodulans]ACL61339.1 conserved hypothetical protein [Methylobacterium nodulans ORS 2060]